MQKWRGGDRQPPSPIWGRDADVLEGIHKRAREGFTGGRFLPELKFAVRWTMYSLCHSYALSGLR
jgi:hypothetical protein